MPEIDKYLAGYGLSKGMTLRGFHLDTIEAQHVQVVRYKEYEYPTKLIWSRVDKSADIHGFEKDLQSKLSGSKTIYTHYGNPYDCNFGYLHFEYSKDQVTVTSTGACSRVYK